MPHQDVSGASILTDPPVTPNPPVPASRGPLVDNETYTQLIHILAIAGVVVWVALNKLTVEQGLAILGLLVGVALPSPFTKATTT